MRRRQHPFPQRADENTNVVGLITDCTGDFDATAGVPGSAATGGECNSVSSSGNLPEKGTLPMDKETFTENVPSDAKSGCELEGKHEQSVPAPTPSPTNVAAEGSPHLSSLTEDHRRMRTGLRQQ